MFFLDIPKIRLITFVLQGIVPPVLGGLIVKFEMASLTVVKVSLLIFNFLEFPH
jgi:hypothetical protein